MSRVRATDGFDANGAPADGHDERAVQSAFAETNRFGRARIRQQRRSFVIDHVTAVVVPGERERCAGRRDLGRREGRGRALARRTAVFVAAVHEREPNSGPVEARTREGPAGRRGRMPKP